MGLDTQIGRKYDCMPNLDIDLTIEGRETSEQAIYGAIGNHLVYLNKLITGLTARVQASLARMDLMEARA